MTPTQNELRSDPQKVRVMVCEEVGWTDIREQDYCDAHVNPYEGPVMQFWEGVSPDGEKGELPDVHLSRDACRDTFEAGMTEEEAYEFNKCLWQILHSKPLPRYSWQLEALDHCLAFLVMKERVTL